jgi:hypothetical protein
MATSLWTERLRIPLAPSPFKAQQSWIEKYRAALLEVNPEKQLNRITEACSAIEASARGPVEHDERQAMEDALFILRLLKEESSDRAGTAPWL